MSIQLLQGNCLELMKSIPDGSIDMILADLPYGTSACKWDSVIPFAPLWEQYERVVKKNGAIVLTSSQPFTSALVMSNADLFRYCWVWEKTKANGFFDVKYRPLKTHEDVAVFGFGGVATGSLIPMTYNPQGVTECKPRKRGIKSLSSTVRSITEPKGEQTRTNYPRSILRFSSEGRTRHPTQKPVALMEYLIRTYTNEGETVLDNTMGSGTTGVACVNTGRDFIGIELDADYFRIAGERIAAAQEKRRLDDQNQQLPLAA